MILADKIIENRKKNGWSQEELADRLGVSRQSVSKWESAQAVPDMKKILQLSEIFHVSTDYLLRDDIGEAEAPEIAVDNGLLEETVRVVTMEDANAFLAHTETSARTISTGVMLCILSPVLLILLGGLSEAGVINMKENVVGGIGISVLLVMIACAVAIFLRAGFRGKPFEFLETLNIDTEYGVSGMVRDRRDRYAETHSRLLIVGIMLCVIAAIPMFILEAVYYNNDSDLLSIAGLGALLVLCAAGVKLIVLTCIRQGGYDKLLEEGDYTRLNKRAGKYDGIYWAVATAVYLAWSFITMRWDITWIVWPIAGVLYAAFREIMKAVVRSRQ